MTVKHFKRNWMLHYLQWVYLYLPERQKQLRKEYKIIINPISYVHSNYHQMGTSLDSTYQYFYADYGNPIDTGTLDFAPTAMQMGGEEVDPIPQLPCTYRIYTYCEELKQYIPIFANGELDTECSEKSLYKNRQSFNLTPNIKYYYREEQASEGDLLHKELEAFGIDTDMNIILYGEEYDDELFNRVEKAKETDEQGNEYNILKLRHYPKLVKIYVTFDKKQETSSVSKHSGIIDFTESTGFAGKIREGYNGILGGQDPGKCDILPSSRYRVFPNKLRITYMEKDINGLYIVPKATTIPETIQTVTDQLVEGCFQNFGGVIYGGGQEGYASGMDVKLPNPCNVEYYLGETLLHRGEEIAWSDNGSPNYEAFQDPEDRVYGHYFYVPGNGGSETDAIGGGGATILSTFWTRLYSSSFVQLTETYYTIPNAEHPERPFIRYRAPFSYASKRKISLQGNRVQKIDEFYTSSFNKPLVRMRINRPKYTAIYTDTEWKKEGVTTTTTERLLADEAYGYAWAGVEDIVGMASWAMPQVTCFDPDGNYYKPYFQWNCQGNMPLYLAWGQYENSKTKDFTKDTISVNQIYDTEDPLVPFESPIIRKGKIANNDVSYAVYDEDQFNFINQNCDQGCSCVVSYVKTTRANYYRFIGEVDPSERMGNWLIK